MIKYEDIVKVNEDIKTTKVKGKDYAEVPQRVKAFRKLYPMGRISTEIISLEGGVCVMRAEAWTRDDSGNDLLLATGTAYEKESSSYINKTSYIENCETSAIGRALGFCGLGIDVSIASKEEVENAINNQNKEEGFDPNKPIDKDQIRRLNKGLDLVSTTEQELLDKFGYKSINEFTVGTFDQAMAQLRETYKEEHHGKEHE